MREGATPRPMSTIILPAWDKEGGCLLQETRVSKDFNGKGEGKMKETTEATETKARSEAEQGDAMTEASNETEEDVETPTDTTDNTLVDIADADAWCSPAYTMADFVLDDVKEWMAEQTQMVQRGLKWKRTYLLEGVPGTGKTSLAMSVAAELQLPLYLLNVNTAGLSPTVVLNLLANTEAPAVVLIEEFDKILGDSADGAADSLTVTDFMEILDGVQGVENKIVFITTNFKELLEVDKRSAVLRPGRIDVNLHFQYADKSQAYRMFLSFGMYKQKDVRRELTRQELEALAREFANLCPVGKCTLSGIQSFVQTFRKNLAGAVAKLKAQHATDPEQGGQLCWDLITSAADQEAWGKYQRGETAKRATGRKKGATGGKQGKGGKGGTGGGSAATGRKGGKGRKEEHTEKGQGANGGIRETSEDGSEESSEADGVTPPSSLDLRVQSSDHRYDSATIARENELMRKSKAPRHVFSTLRDFSGRGLGGGRMMSAPATYNRASPEEAALGAGGVRESDT